MRPSDTSPEAWRVLIDLQRRMRPEEKLRRAMRLGDSILSAAAAGFRRQFPDAGERELFCVLRASGWAMTSFGSCTERNWRDVEPLAGPLSRVLAALRDLGIRHIVGGSIASSVRGVLRATIDVDLVAAISPLMVDRLLTRLGPEWYGDADSIRRLMAAGQHFNLIHIPTSEKVDIFPARTEFHAVQLERASVETFEYMGVPVECPVAAAEDILLAKLRWYRDGGEVSDRQWSDVTGIIAVQESMDDEYLEQWAARLGVADLLERARKDAALD